MISLLHLDSYSLFLPKPICKTQSSTVQRLSVALSSLRNLSFVQLYAGFFFPENKDWMDINGIMLECYFEAPCEYAQSRALSARQNSLLMLAADP